MSKNQHFKKQYTVTIEGISTNLFILKVIEPILKTVIDGMDHYYKQVSVSIEDIK